MHLGNVLVRVADALMACNGLHVGFGLHDICNPFQTIYILIVLLLALSDLNEIDEIFHLHRNRGTADRKSVV